jgi:molybdopterin molybdotransferase
MDEALALLRERVRPVAGIEPVPLHAADGRVLAADLAATIDLPAQDNAAVDGYAFAAADLAAAGETVLRVAGRAAAGHPLDRPLARGEAARVFTGAVLPEGADTVVMQEDAAVDHGSLRVPPGLKAGANRRRAGEDVRAGQVVLAAGRRLRPPDLGLAAALGHASLPVRRRLRVALFSTGDELLEPGGAPAPGHAFDANRYLLHPLLAGLGCAVDDLGILADRAMLVREALAGAAATHDLLLTSGGMSTGEEDHVRAAVEALGRLHFWRLAIKPGRPLALGQVGATPFLGLPGNPVAAMVSFLRFARPLILLLSGADEPGPAFYRVPAGFAYSKKGRRREWVRVRLRAGPGGVAVAEKFPRQGSGILTSMVQSDGLVELAEEITEVTPGMMVDYLPFREVGA